MGENFRCWIVLHQHASWYAVIGIDHEHGGLVTHNMQQAARISDETAVFMVDTDDGVPTGVLVEYNPTSKVFTQPDDPRTEDYISGRVG